MPFNQMMLFPTAFKLVSTRDGLRLRATPIEEIERLHGKAWTRSSLTAAEANRALDRAGSGPLDVRVKVMLEKDKELAIRYQGKTLATIKPEELENGQGAVEVLIDKAVAEIFVDGGARYIVREIPTSTGDHGFELGLGDDTKAIKRLEVWRMQSIWNAHVSSRR